MSVMIPASAAAYQYEHQSEPIQAPSWQLDNSKVGHDASCFVAAQHTNPNTQLSQAGAQTGDAPAFYSIYESFSLPQGTAYQSEQAAYQPIYSSASMNQFSDETHPDCLGPHPGWNRVVATEQEIQVVEQPQLQESQIYQHCNTLQQQNLQPYAQNDWYGHTYSGPVDGTLLKPAGDLHTNRPLQGKASAEGAESSLPEDEHQLLDFLHESFSKAPEEILPVEDPLPLNSCGNIMLPEKREQAVDSSSLPDSANFENRPIDEGCMGRTSGVQLQKGSSSQVGNLGNRLGSTDSMTDAQRARTRETARRLRQRKAEAMQKLRQDVHTLAEENRSLTCQLKDSMNLLGHLNHQNSGLRLVLQYLRPTGTKNLPSLASLLELKAVLEQEGGPPGQGQCSENQAETLAAAALEIKGSRPGPAVEHLVQCAVNWPHNSNRPNDT